MIEIETGVVYVVRTFTISGEILQGIFYERSNAENKKKELDILYKGTTVYNTVTTFSVMDANRLILGNS